MKLNSSTANQDAGESLSIILLSAGMLSLVISFMGIKLRWFRHRLTLEQPTDQVESPVLLRTSSVTEFRENCARGVYRQATDDSLIFVDQPPTTPTNSKKKTKNNNRGSIWRMPFRTKLTLSKLSSRDDNQITTIQHAASVHQSRELDLVTLQKNEHLKRMIHDKLSSRNSASMPDLAVERTASPLAYRELSVDEYSETQRIAGKVDTPKDEILKKVGRTEVTLDSLPSTSNEIGKEENLRNHVKFGEVVEFEETIYEADDVFHEDNLKYSKQRFDSLDGTTDVSHSSNEVTDEADSYYVEEIQIDLPPPTPMKRKSRENSFNTPPDQEVAKAEPPAVKPRTRRLLHRTSSDLTRSDEEYPNFEETPNVVEIAVQNKPIIETRIDIHEESRHEREIFEKIKASPPDKVEEKVNIQEFIKARDGEETKARDSTKASEVEEFTKSLEKEPKAPQPNVSLHEETPRIHLPVDELKPLNSQAGQFVAETTEKALQVIEVQVEAPQKRPTIDAAVEQQLEVQAPKSILKSSDTSTTQKSITFQNEPETIYHSAESSSSSSYDSYSDEEEDVWSRVDQHRFHLTRSQPDVPPPLPKTPPPTAEEEEKQFSFA